MKPTSLRVAALLTALIATLGCGDDDLSADFAGPYDPGDTPADAGGGMADAASDASAPPVDAAEDTFVPEEPELPPPVVRAAASERFVFVASPSVSSVAKIDLDTLAVTPIQVGADPREVQTVPGRDTVVVLNAADDTVSIIDAAPDRDRERRVDVVAGSNRLTVAPTGGVAVAWYENARAVEGDRIGSLQDVSVVRFSDAGDDAFDVSVGFNIRAVTFDRDAETVFVVTDSGISVIDVAELSGDTAAPQVSFGDDPLVDEIDRETVIAGDGSYAVLRSSAHQGVRVVDLESGDAASVALPAVPTDVDLIGDDTALVALRDNESVAVLPLADVVADPEAFEVHALPAPAGLVTLLGESSGLGYTTLGDDLRLSVLAVGDDVDAAVSWLRKPIRGVVAAPDGASALVLHEATDAGDDGLGGAVAASPAVTVFDVASAYAKLVLLETTPTEVVYTATGAHVFLLVTDGSDASRELVSVDTATFATSRVRLDAPPEAIGVVPGSDRVFVAQESTSGRLAIIDAATGEVRHVSAFQLNAFID